MRRKYLFASAGVLAACLAGWAALASAQSLPGTPPAADQPAGAAKDDHAPPAAPAATGGEAAPATAPARLPDRPPATMPAPEPGGPVSPPISVPPPPSMAG